MTGDSAALSVLDGNDIVYVARTSVRTLLRLEAHVGSRFPAYATSMGRVLLAGLGPERFEQYLRTQRFVALTDQTVTDPARLRQIIEDCRRIMRQWKTNCVWGGRRRGPGARPVRARGRRTNSSSIPGASAKPSRARALAMLRKASQQISPNWRACQASHSSAQVSAVSRCLTPFRPLAVFETYFRYAAPAEKRRWPIFSLSTTAATSSNRSAYAQAEGAPRSAPRSQEAGSGARPLDTKGADSVISRPHRGPMSRPVRRYPPTPTRFGNMCAQMRNFLDRTGPLWMRYALVGKVGGVFSSTASQHGGQETTITFPFDAAAVMIIGLPYTFKDISMRGRARAYGAS
jgi:hypothetical protein